jgi:arylsulfatase A-like enzyme
MLSMEIPGFCPGRFAILLGVVFAVLSAGCGAPSDGVPDRQRLVDDFRNEWIRDTVPGAGVPEPTEWRFDSSAEGWTALRGIADLRVEDGHLVGRTTDAAPILALDVPGGFRLDDAVHEVLVTMHASAGERVSAHFIGAEPTEIDAAVQAGAPVPWFHSAERTESIVRIRPILPVTGYGMHRLLLKPSDAVGATFKIDSIRVLFRNERLASIPSGIGWHGLEEIYRETVVARVPETLRWPLTLPLAPRLSLDLGTLQGRPLTFRVTVEGLDGEREVLRRTVTTALRWEAAEVDLTPWAGRAVTLAFQLEAEDGGDGTLGLWGSPVVLRGNAPAPGQVAARPVPRGVIFLLVDTLRSDRLAPWGHDRETAPTLSRLAAEGTLFEHTIAQGSWTKVSAPSMLTSLYPTTVGVRDFLDRVPASATTLAEVFRAAGFATVGYSSVPFTGKFNNLHQGYEELHERAMNPAESKTGRHFVDRLLPWLERRQDEPFFVFLHVFDPHSPYEPVSPFNHFWITPQEAAAHRTETERLIPHIEDPLRQLSKMPYRNELEAAGLDPEHYIGDDQAWYDGSIRALDMEIQRLLERLEELGRADDTLIVFASDHGEEFLDHGKTFHGQSVYGELLRVPMLFHYPAAIPAGRVTETVQLIDLMPTVLNLAGLPIPAEAQGHSTVPLILPESARGAGVWRPRPAVSEKPAAEAPMVPPPRDVESFAFQWQGYKLIHNAQRREGMAEYELYDAVTDPLDQHDLTAEQPAVVEHLAGLLEAWKKDAAADRLPSDDAAGAHLDPEELERLRSLGYVN